MNTFKAVSLTAVAAVASALAQAQTPPPASGQTAEPGAASSPHQRAATGTGTPEAANPGSADPAEASSPHQRDATGAGPTSSGRMRMAKAQSVTPTMFVDEAAQDGMTEVELGKLAMNKAQDPAIKQFAERMVRDHGKANADLAAIAQSKNLTVPKSLDAQHQAMVTSLQSKSGAAFDSAYARAMDADHEKAINLFERASSLSDADLAGFAQKTLPTLTSHKHMADALSSGAHSADKSGAQRRE